jgi:hypothetical protein
MSDIYQYGHPNAKALCLLAIDLHVMTASRVSLNRRLNARKRALATDIKLLQLYQLTISVEDRARSRRTVEEKMAIIKNLGEVL